LIRVTFAAIAFVILGAVAAYGLGFSLGGTYFLGIPVGETKITAVHYGGETTPVDMTDGWPFKVGPANFALTSLTAVTPSWNIEAGFEVHPAYYNKEAAIDYGGGVSYVEPEDNVKWSLWNVYGGVRFNIPSGAKVRPFVVGGAIFGRSTYELKDLEGGGAVEVSSSGPAFGLYAGGGAAVDLSDKVALHCPIRFNMLSAAEYSYEGSVSDFSNDWKPGPYVTAGLGITYALK